MAPLTWRNVDAPSFASPNQLWSLSAELMNRGFNSASRGLEKFREITTDEQSARLMQDVMAAGNDPEAIARVAQNGNGAFLSPEALRFANNQPGVLLDREASRAGIDQTRMRTNVLEYGLDRSRITDSREDAEYNAGQEANPILFQIQQMARAGDLSGAQALAAENSDLLGRAGIDPNTLYSGISTGYNGQIADTQAGINHQDFMRIANTSMSSRELLDRAGQMFGSQAEAEQAIRDAQAAGIITADVATETINGLGSSGLWAEPTEFDSVLDGIGVGPLDTGGGTNNSWATGLDGSNPVFNGFMSTIQSGGVTNPNALAAIAATGHHESGFSAGNVNRTWEDNSESGRELRAGGTMSWNGPRLAALQEFAAARGESGNGSPQTQALFFLQEDPQLIEALNNAGSVEEAVTLMNNAWRFAGYDREGNAEAAGRLNTARGILGGEGLTFGPNVPTTTSGPAPSGSNPSAFDMLMTEAMREDGPDLTFGDRFNSDAPSSVGTLLNTNEQTNESTREGTARNTAPLVSGPETNNDAESEARVTAMMERILSEPVEDVEPAQIIEAGTAGNNPLFTETDNGGVVARPPTSQPEVMMISRAARAGILETTPERSARQAEIDGRAEAMLAAEAAAPNRNYQFGQDGGALSDLGMIGAMTGEAVVNQGAGLIDAINTPFNAVSRYLTGEEYFGETGRVDWDRNGIAQSVTSPITGTSRDLVAEARNNSPAPSSPSGSPNQGGGQERPASPPSVPGRITATDMGERLRTARNTGVADVPNDTLRSMDDALLGEGALTGQLEDIAAQLTGEDGPLSNFSQSDVSGAISRIASELGIRNNEAAALLKTTQNYTGTEWNPWNWGTDLQYDMEDIRETWRQYQQENRNTDAVTRLNNRERSDAAIQSVQEYQEAYDIIVAEMQARLRAARTPEERARITEAFETQIFPALAQRVQSIDMLDFYASN